MSHLNSEVSKKIRSAIKAKLVELGAYVDEELPDYIMVMVLNKKSKETLNQDLKLFLNKDTETFVDWLLHVLDKLEEVVSLETKRKERKERKKVRSQSRDPPKKKRGSSSSPPRLKSKVVAPPPPDDSEGEYNPEKILKKSLLASSIKVPERKRGSIEANKTLVLKAVAEADQSIKKRKAQERLRDPEPLPSGSELKDSATEGGDLRERLIKKRQQRKKETELRRIRRRSSSDFNQEEEEEDLEKMREMALESLKRKKQSLHRQSRKIVVEDAKRRTKTSILSSHSSSSSARSRSSSVEKKTETKTKFIVTLEGIHSQYFKSRRESHSPGLRNGSNKDLSIEKESLEPQQKREFSSGLISLDENKVSREKKKPEAKVAPMQPIKKPEKPKRKRITAPELSSQPLIASPLSNGSFLEHPLPSSVVPQCKYWPNCTRGVHCFYKHPDKLNSIGSFALKSKYSWTAASIPPQ